MTAKKPWEVNPSLCQERLQLLAREAVRVRHEALVGHEPSKGDDTWVLGCRAYRRTCFAISELAKSGRYPWLTVKEDRLYFAFYVDNEPIRFYRGEAEHPSARYLRTGNLESGGVYQQRLPFGGELSRNLGWFWLMAIETDEQSRVARVVMVQATEGGDTRHVWSVPLEGVVPASEAELPGLSLPLKNSKPTPRKRAAASRANRGVKSRALWLKESFYDSASFACAHRAYGHGSRR